MRWVRACCVRSFLVQLACGLCAGAQLLACSSPSEPGSSDAPAVPAFGAEPAEGDAIGRLEPGPATPAQEPPSMSPSDEGAPIQLPIAETPAPTPAPAAPSTPPPAPEAPMPPDPNLTRGSGGPVGPAELSSRGGLTYLIDAPPGDGARGLLVLLHGSTASNYENFIRLMREVASDYDLIPVSVLAPNGQGWNEGNQVRAAELLHRLVQEDLYPSYNVDRRRVIFSGQSSGGGFLSSNFVPAHAQDYQGGAFLQCGAAPPNIAFMPAPETRQRFRMHFEITTGDPIWPEYYAAALSAYGSAQMQFSMDNTKPGGHCQFDQQQVILDHIDFVLGTSPTAP